MRMIPAAVTAGTRSSAERRFFKLLQRSPSLGQRATAYHSMNLSRHDYKRVGELDFVITTPRDVLVLEVKGGGVSCQEGIWTFTDRFGEEHRTTEGPFRQARSGMFSLEHRVRDELGSRIGGALVFGYGVIFPDCDFDVSSVEWEPDLVLDARLLRREGALDVGLERMLEHWRQLTPDRTGLSPEDYVGLGRLLRPDFDRIPPLRARADQLDVAMEELTEEQFVALDFLADWPRLVFLGGAGTGKTFLAAEAARRHAAEGATVLYICPRPRLAAFLRPRLEPAGVTVSTPADAAATADVLIVDEAQDLMNLDDLDRLEQLVDGGLTGGVWLMFLDPNRQHSLVGPFDPEALELLIETGAHRVPLKRNCRNTPQIVEQTQLYTGGDLGSAVAGDGPPVDFIDVRDGETVADAVERALEGLFSGDIAPAQVTVLSAAPSLDESCVRATSRWRRKRIREIDEAILAEWPSEQLTCSTIDDFKGLENQFIVLTDLDRLPSEAVAMNRLYVGMSRARAGLLVVLTAEARGRLAAMAASLLEEAPLEPHIGLSG